MQAVNSFEISVSQVPLQRGTCLRETITEEPSRFILAVLALNLFRAFKNTETLLKTQYFYFTRLMTLTVLNSICSFKHHQQTQLYLSVIKELVIILEKISGGTPGSLINERNSLSHGNLRMCILWFFFPFCVQWNILIALHYKTV